MESAVLHNIPSLRFMIVLSGGDRPAIVTLANLVAFAFFPVFILKNPTIDCEHENYSKKNKTGSCVMRRFDRSARIMKVYKFES